MIEQLNETWTGILQYLNGIVVPDWGGLVNLLPIFLLIGVVGPLLSLVVLFWFIYFVRKPRLRVAYVDPRRPAPRDDQGSPVFPAGEPYSRGRGDDLRARRHAIRRRRPAPRPLPQVRPRPTRGDRHLRQLRAVLRDPPADDLRSDPPGPPPGGAAVA